MKIDLSQEEYRVLLDLLHVAEVVLSSHRQEDDERSAGHRQLLQKLYARAQEAGLSDLITHHPSEGRYHPSDRFEELSAAHTFLDEYVNHVFWDQLVRQLTERDAAVKAGGSEKLEALNDDERERIEQPIKDRYLKEFSENGLTNLAVVERFGAGAAVRTSD